MGYLKGLFIIYFLCIFPFSIYACDEFERSFVIQKLIIMNMKKTLTPDGGFVMLARKCGFQIGKSKDDTTSSFFYKPIKTPHDIDSIIRKATRSFGIDPLLVKAIIRVESSFAIHAISPKGARGLMQIMPSTARRLGVEPNALWDPEVNIHTGVKYLYMNLKRFRSLKRALIAYNAGERFAERVSSPEDLEALPKETRIYLKRVIFFYRKYQGQYLASHQ